ncbi:MAG: CheR family methyltransferase [Euryarchaeota archaeon]|nr:CheR family methyltransferase [Euryarchaeota archaeon]
MVIYFSKDLQKRLYNKFYDALNRDGYFVIGKTETLVGDARYKFRSVNSIAGKVHNEYLKDVYSEEEFSIRNRDVGEMHRIWMGNFGRPGIGIEDQGDHR